MSEYHSMDNLPKEIGQQHSHTSAGGQLPGYHSLNLPGLSLNRYLPPGLPPLGLPQLPASQLGVFPHAPSHPPGLPHPPFIGICDEAREPQTVVQYGGSAASAANLPS
ncbi:hypothetical protein GYMLUDRAFT_250394 [Collybiopsis luxurians FD-317 M1]|uniref:Uncharacterized protein n=1 Tax=Collybiopsis luxurians FD-317 M1 TaxID=944289 RepID=A0A0D0C6J2_9AGAR|nr:hypothetical protein GYMLUDRAFT_250394 [Collybiopsis luxurians FD-317 M1]